MKGVCCRRERTVSAPAAIGRRSLLRGALTAAAVLGIGGAVPRTAAARQRGGTGSSAAPPNGALALARFVNNTSYRDLPPQAIEHAKMILASTFASAASGSRIDSARILRDLAKERAGARRPRSGSTARGCRRRQAARVNAVLSDAAASDDSDIRNIAHEGTTLTSVGLAIGERTGAIGAGSAGGDGHWLRGGGPHRRSASRRPRRLARLAGRRLRRRRGRGQAPEAHGRADGARPGIAATTVGGLAIGTNSWAREYMGANAALAGSTRPWPPVAATP